MQSDTFSCSLRLEDVEKTADFLKTKTNIRPFYGIICGSGLGGLANQLNQKQTISYKDIPGFPISTVPGHAGQLVFGMLASKAVVCMQGRVHGYEGCPMWKMTFPVRVMRELGVHTLIVTNAAGSVNPSYNVGDLMIIKDHINISSMVGRGPLIGLMDDRLGSRFPAMSGAYDRDLRLLAWGVAHSLGYDFLHEGIYGFQFGPAFETVAESRMMKMLGSDVCGMSTAPEVLVAKQCGLRVFGLSLITNNCVMDLDSSTVTSHTEVLSTASKRADDLELFIHTLMDQMSEPESNDNSTLPIQ